MSAVTAVGEGRYALGEHIATGGMGEVWQATDTVLGRDVAVKILKSELADDPTFRARLQAEARNTAGLHHPGIAQVFDFGEVVDPDTARSTSYLVMELVRGEPLSTLLAGGRTIRPEQAAEIVAQSASAIDYAHQRGIVHRDVKPANLLVTPDGGVKVTDFGIARAADAVPLTQTGQVIGTPHYLSPEQARGAAATPASDVYALGVVLYECLAGSRPFTADSPVAVAMQHLRDPAPALPDSVPAGLAAVVLQALAKDPEERPQTAADLAARLRDPDYAPPAAGTATTGTLPAGPAAGAAAGAGAAAAGTALLTSPSGTAAPPPPGDSAGRGPDRRRRRGLWWLPALAAAAVVVAVAAVALAFSGDDPGPSGSGSDGDPAQPSAGSSEPRDSGSGESGSTTTRTRQQDSGPAASEPAEPAEDQTDQTDQTDPQDEPQGNANGHDKTDSGNEGNGSSEGNGNGLLDTLPGSNGSDDERED